MAVATENNLSVLASTTDLYEAVPGFIETNEALYEVQTFYERMFLSQGYKITYMAFTIDHDGPYMHPRSFDSDYWRSVEGPRRFSHSPASSQR
jgi:tRNA (guanine-N7-)-methyltransferase